MKLDRSRVRCWEDVKFRSEKLAIVLIRTPAYLSTFLSDATLVVEVCGLLESRLVARDGTLELRLEPGELSGIVGPLLAAGHSLVIHDMAR